MNYTYSIPSEAGYNLTQGVDKYFSWIIFEEPTFINYFLIFIWSVIFIGGNFTEKKLTSNEDFKKWGLIASFITFGMALILSLATSFNSASALIVSLAILIGFLIAEFYPKS